MTSTRLRALYPGVYGPLPTFFDENEELDLVSFKTHLLKLANLGIVPVCGGSLGEAVHLNSDERKCLIRFTRETLNQAGLGHLPIVAGVGGASLRETVQYAKDAAATGADAGMVILPAYYAASLGTDTQQIIQYFVDICRESPLPILLYNFPANAGGVDMSSRVIEGIIRQAPNLCGVKLTCAGNIGKLLRLASTLESEPDLNTGRPFPFLFLDGFIADYLPWMSGGGHGTVSGLPNFAPRTVVKLFQYSCNPSPSLEETKEAQRLQAILSRADVTAMPAGVRGMKYVLNRMFGFGTKPRRPLLPLDTVNGDLFFDSLQELLAVEAELEAKALTL